MNTYMWTMSAVGGITGSVLAAILIDRYDPRYCFFFSSAMGLLITLTALRLGVSLEQLDDEDTQNLSLYENSVRNLGEIKLALQIKEYYSLITYLLISGLVCPSFGMFGYYFLIDVLGLTNFTISMLTLLGFVGVIVGTFMYQRWFNEFEFRSMVLIETAFCALLMPFSLVLVFRINLAWGIPDLSLIIFSETFGEIVSQCFTFLPFAVLIAKICPKRIEATAYALFASFINLRSPMRAFIGSKVNDIFVGVTEEDLGNYKHLVLINFFCGFIPLAFLWLIPTRK